MERYSDRAIEIINELHRERLDYQSKYLPLIDAANELSAYEDTGLEPEQVMQTIDPESLRPRGHWEKETVDGPDVVKYTSLFSVFCSRCRCRRRAWTKSTYCPHCGAKMEEKKND